MSGVACAHRDKSLVSLLATLHLPVNVYGWPVGNSSVLEIEATHDRHAKVGLGDDAVVVLDDQVGSEDVAAEFVLHVAHYVVVGQREGKVEGRGDVIDTRVGLGLGVDLAAEDAIGFYPGDHFESVALDGDVETGHQLVGDGAGHFGEGRLDGHDGARVEVGRPADAIVFGVRISAEVEGKAPVGRVEALGLARVEGAYIFVHRVHRLEDQVFYRRKVALFGICNFKCKVSNFQISRPTCRESSV